MIHRRYCLKDEDNNQVNSSLDSHALSHKRLYRRVKINNYNHNYYNQSSLLFY